MKKIQGRLNKAWFLWNWFDVSIGDIAREVNLPVDIVEEHIKNKENDNDNSQRTTAINAKI